MIYLLDTNTCIVYLKRPLSQIRQRLLSLSDSDVAVCSVAKAELFYGSMKSNNPIKSLEIQREFLNRFISLPFDDKASEIYGIIRAQLEAQGTPIGPYDLQIASIAIANNLTLVTHSVAEFSRILQLHWEDWEQ